MTILMPQIASRLFGEPLLVDPAKLSAIMTGLGGRIVEGGLVLPGIAATDHKAFAGGRPSERAGVVGNSLTTGAALAERRGYRLLQRVGGVGVIPIEGTLIQKGKWIGSYSGDTSYEGIRALASLALNDPDVKGVVYEVDSYGGEVAGAFETAAALRQLSEAKPTLAILTDYAFSAGYLMASSARRIVMPPGGGAGSIGVVAMHVDYSGALEKAGIAVSFVHAGARKVEGNPYQPLPDGVRSEMQQRVDASYERFLAAVAEGRKGKLGKAAARKTEAATYSGAAAVAAGLVDGIVEIDAAFDRFSKSVS